MDEPMIGKLRNISLFRDLPEHELETLAGKVVDRTYAPGEAIIHKGDIGDSLFLIVDGAVKVVSEDAQGGELILNQCKPGETVGEMSMLDQDPRSATVIATVPTRALELKHAAFMDTITQRPELSLYLIRSITARLRFATTYIEKAIDWSKRIAEGDYAAAMTQLRGENAEREEVTDDESKANQLLAAFFQMIQEVQAREDELKKEVRKLSLEIDEARRRQQVHEVTDTGFFSQLKSEAARLRRERAEDSE
ncbi:MAG: cyclic nucleotide-binding domain-containing protein [Anaerolineales bacterium]|nr:cyclic nucleotide-binding domain-containing protein [Anaerolineales bacterium]